MQEKWLKLLNSGRRKAEFENRVGGEKSLGASDKPEYRTELERDYDRILFSTPVRRLADKTQVFPLDKNDSVRNRLTHSHEVSNLARSIGVTFATTIRPGIPDGLRNIPAVLGAVGLVHDLGNPPFGHQGEAAIRKWFAAKKNYFLKTFGDNNKKLLEDFLKFEGNAQTFRLVTRLQLINDGFGLDLTRATLAAMMKYPTSSYALDKEFCAKKKHGFFESDRKVAEDVLASVGLSVGCRHPLAYIMEACDDIAYASIDVEDCIKKGLASFNDVLVYLENNCAKDELVLSVVQNSKKKFDEYSQLGLSANELDDISIQRFRVYSIGAMINSVIDYIINNAEEIESGKHPKPLLEKSAAHTLRECLGDFTKKHAFTNRTVLELELKGFNTITELMDIFWFAIQHAQCSEGVHGIPKGEHPFARYVYSRISENYRRVFEHPLSTDSSYPIDYRRCLLLTDMMSGMTDSYALNILDELKSYKTFNLKI